MGKKIVLRSANFETNGFKISVVDYSLYANTKEENVLVLGKWEGTGEATNVYHINVPIPSGVSKIIVDASTIETNFEGKTASQVNTSIVSFLSDTPSDTSVGTIEPNYISEIRASVGNTVEGDVPSNAILLSIDIGYWGANGTFVESRIPHQIIFM